MELNEDLDEQKVLFITFMFYECYESLRKNYIQIQGYLGKLSYKRYEHFDILFHKGIIGGEDEQIFLGEFYRINKDVDEILNELIKERTLESLELIKQINKTFVNETRDEIFEEGRKVNHVWEDFFFIYNQFKRLEGKFQEMMKDGFKEHIYLIKNLL